LNKLERSCINGPLAVTAQIFRFFKNNFLNRENKFDRNEEIFTRDTHSILLFAVSVPTQAQVEPAIANPKTKWKFKNTGPDKRFFRRRQYYNLFRKHRWPLVCAKQVEWGTDMENSNGESHYQHSSVGGQF
jgi:hypothetical protein